METKTNEPVKQEGEFKIRKKTTPKKLVETKDNVTKVNINSKEPLVEVPNNVTKVEIKKQEDAIQIGETETLDVGEQTGDSSGVDKQVPESSEAIEEVIPIQEITEEEQEVAPSEWDMYNDGDINDSFYEFDCGIDSITIEVGDYLKTIIE